jgi:hypothetical protein
MEASALFDWSRVRHPEGGAQVRVWFRRLANDFWGGLLQPRWFHTWIEIVDPDDRPAEAPIAVGVYDKERDGDRRALLMSQRWEYEGEQLDYYDPAYLLVNCPKLDEESFEAFRQIADFQREENLGPYAFVCAWNDIFVDEDALNCMIWVESFVRAQGGPSDVLARASLAFGAHLGRRARRTPIFDL